MQLYTAAGKVNLDKHHHHLSFDRNASFVPFELTQKNIINHLYCFMQMQRPKSQSHCRQQIQKRRSTHISCVRKLQAVRMRRGRGKGKLVHLDHWHLLLSWPASPGSKQKKSCQVSVTGLRASAFAFSVTVWDSQRKSILELDWKCSFSPWGFIQNGKGLLAVFVNTATERARHCSF